MASTRKPLPPLVVLDHPEAPISPRQRAAWWHVAAALQRLEQQKIAQQCAKECVIPPWQETTPLAQEPTSCPPQRAD